MPGPRCKPRSILNLMSPTATQWRSFPSFRARDVVSPKDAHRSPVNARRTRKRETCQRTSNVQTLKRPESAPGPSTLEGVRERTPLNSDQRHFLHLKDAMKSCSRKTLICDENDVY